MNTDDISIKLFLEAPNQNKFFSLKNMIMK